MQQVYRRTPMPKCDFNKVALQMPFHFVYQEQYPVKNMKFNVLLIVWEKNCKIFLQV